MDLQDEALEHLAFDAAVANHNGLNVDTYRIGVHSNQRCTDICRTSMSVHIFHVDKSQLPRRTCYNLIMDAIKTIFM